MTAAPRPRRIGVLTSGGDAPGMNACLRAIVRTAIYHNLEIIGFQHGFRGVLLGESQVLDARSVANIIQRGGTILGSARAPEMRHPEGLKQAASTLKGLGIDALLVIGGNGSMQGALALADYWQGQLIGLPGTIDNDLGGTDWTIGFFTALDTALNAVDRLRDTADAFDRIFLLEVMGRDAGWIALFTGIGGGAEEILISEQPYDPVALSARIKGYRARNKRSVIVVVAEGACPGGVAQVAADIEGHGFETRTCVLGHIQRGGSPVALDRYLATEMGVFAVQAALDGATLVLVGKQGQSNQLVPLREALADCNHRPPTHLLEINRFLSI
ncbi:ATP-dependent 6-phosphofructokinase [Chromatium okenii]|uniref:ATP-dependent 6-phosphofructokinase n=1 Tax=Chromatium okenii TaxID=61644 RepID=UPI001907509B|nr:ATP-dependent 6-phosphofructokinase [Chromatium okenii]MBK1642585.1 ATP-dependent 6-phosphofructokinase [Chromatium okenii]